MDNDTTLDNKVCQTILGKKRQKIDNGGGA